MNKPDLVYGIVFDESEKYAYFYWLLDLIDLWDMGEMRSYVQPYYYHLLWKMHNIIFEPLNDYDDNRASDGVKMRREWIYKEVPFDVSLCDYGGLEGPCSVLEMLVGLSYRLSNDYGYPCNCLFWAMMDTLGLTKYPTTKNVPYVEDEIACLMKDIQENRAMILPYKPENHNIVARDIWYQCMWAFYDFEDFFDNISPESFEMVSYVTGEFKMKDLQN